MNFKIKWLVLSLSLFLLTAQSIHAQDLLKGKDLSTVKVDLLSDADIAKLKTQLTSSGVTIDQVEQQALAKGMSPTEYAKLKLRLADPASKNNAGKLKAPEKTKASAEKIDNSTDTLDTEKYNQKPLKTLINPLIFGSELYTSVAPSFEPNLNMATPANYVLGPDDQILVSVYGVQEYNGDLLVSAEGNITIPNVGQIKVSGLSIEAATQKIKTTMGNGAYAYLKSGGSKLSVSLSKIRSIKVTIIGANRPGTYRLSSLASVFNALYLSGGPTAFGSFREIELVRNSKVERKVDLYRMLLNGDQTDNIGLKDNDVIRIPSYKVRVEIQGQVKRPGIFEVLPNETFANIIAFASGFTDTAYRASVKVFQQNEKERLVHDLAALDFGKYQPQTGDVFVASKILNRFKNRVTLTGAVQRPDFYELTPNLKVADLIRKADGLKPDAYTDRASIIRYQEDLTRSILSFDVKKALNGDEVQLKKLAAKGTDINLKDDMGNTPAHYALLSANDNNLSGLIDDLGADINIKNKSGISVKDVLDASDLEQARLIAKIAQDIDQVLSQKKITEHEHVEEKSPKKMDMVMIESAEHEDTDRPDSPRTVTIPEDILHGLKGMRYDEKATSTAASILKPSSNKSR